LSTWSTTRVVSWGPIAAKKTYSSTKASTRFTNGPAAITTIRFHTGCAWYARSRTSSGRSSSGFIPLIFT
jgi:hypothetical protein